MMSQPQPKASIPADPEGGIVFAYRFPGDAPAIALTDVSQVNQAGGFLWVHLNLTDVRARHFIESFPDLPEPAREALLAAHAHAGFDHEAGDVWGAIPDFVMEIDDRTQDITMLRVALGRNYVVTARRRPLEAVRRVRGMILRGKRLDEPAALFETLVERIAQTLDEIIAEHSAVADAVEETIVDSDSDDDRKSIAPLRRAAVRLDRMVSTMHDVLRRFEHQRAHELPETLREAAHRLAQRFEALRQEVHGLNDRARLLQDEVSAKLASQTNDNLYVLSVMTVIIMPATLVTGFFGMNTSNLFFKDSDWGTWLALGVCVAASSLTWLLLKKRGVLE